MNQLESLTFFGKSIDQDLKRNGLRHLIMLKRIHWQGSLDVRGVAQLPKVFLHTDLASRLVHVVKLELPTVILFVDQVGRLSRSMPAIEELHLYTIGATSFDQQVVDVGQLAWQRVTLSGPMQHGPLLALIAFLQSSLRELVMNNRRTAGFGIGPALLGFHFTTDSLFQDAMLPANILLTSSFLASVVEPEEQFTVLLAHTGIERNRPLLTIELLEALQPLQAKGLAAILCRDFRVTMARCDEIGKRKGIFDSGRATGAAHAVLHGPPPIGGTRVWVLELELPPKLFLQFSPGFDFYT